MCSDYLNVYRFEVIRGVLKIFGRTLLFRTSGSFQKNCSYYGNFGITCNTDNLNNTFYASITLVVASLLNSSNVGVKLPFLFIGIPEYLNSFKSLGYQM